MVSWLFGISPWFYNFLSIKSASFSSKDYGGLSLVCLNQRVLFGNRVTAGCSIFIAAPPLGGYGGVYLQPTDETRWKVSDFTSSSPKEVENWRSNCQQCQIFKLSNCQIFKLSNFQIVIFQIVKLSKSQNVKISKCQQCQIVNNVKCQQYEVVKILKFQNVIMSKCKIVKMSIKLSNCHNIKCHVLSECVD